MLLQFPVILVGPLWNDGYTYRGRQYHFGGEIMNLMKSVGQAELSLRIPLLLTKLSLPQKLKCYSKYAFLGGETDCEGPPPRIHMREYWPAWVYLHTSAQPSVKEFGGAATPKASIICFFLRVFTSKIWEQSPCNTQNMCGRGEWLQNTQTL